MNVVLLPMWLLSGSFFPLAGAPRWLGLLMRLNPLTYGIAALRGTLAMASTSPMSPTSPTLPVAIPLAITVAMALLAFAADLVVTRGGRVE
jgi:ABC-2 type transport system permease protein